MLYVACELGNYSIKFVQYHLDKKAVQIHIAEEVVLDLDLEKDQLNYQTIWSNQLDIIAEYTEKIEQECFLLISLPGDIITTRYLSLPVKNKKSAIQMLPFQIEEDLPFSLQDCHWSVRLKQEDKLTHATVGIMKQQMFHDFFGQLKDKSLEPSILTCDVSGFAQFIELNNADYEQAFCILDIGHQVTKGFFFQDGVLVSNHQSFVAGEVLNEAISKSYDIPEEEAIIYKHQNSFLLTERQAEQANENQKEFARLMDATLEPLISEIKRWDIGHRVKYHQTIQAIYLCGGGANIQNATNYLSQKTGIPVKIFNPYQHHEPQDLDADVKFRNKFCSLMTLVFASQKKSGFINYLKAPFVFTSKFGLPLDSFMFIFSRTAIIAFFVSIIFTVNWQLAKMDINSTKKLKDNTLKNDKLGLKNSEKRGRPVSILALLEKKYNLLDQDLRLVKSSLKGNALSDLLDLIPLIQGEDAEISFFKKTSAGMELLLKSKDLDPLKRIQTAVETGKKNLITVIDENNLQLQIKTEAPSQ